MFAKVLYSFFFFKGDKIVLVIFIILKFFVLVYSMHLRPISAPMISIHVTPCYAIPSALSTHEIFSTFLTQNFYRDLGRLHNRILSALHVVGVLTTIFTIF